MANTKYNPNIIKLILFDKGISAEDAARMGKMTPRKFESMTCPGKDHGWGTRRQIADIFGYKPGIFSEGRTLKDLEDNGLLTTTASRIYYLMLQNGMDEEELAKKSNIRLKDLNSYLCRKCNPSGQTLRRLADALDTTTEFLKTGETDDGKEKEAYFNSATLKLVMFICGFTEQDMEHVIPKETMHRALRNNAKLSKNELKQVAGYTNMPQCLFLEKNPEKDRKYEFLFSVAPYRIYYMMAKNGMDKEDLAEKADLPIDTIDRALRQNYGISDGDYKAIEEALNANPGFIIHGFGSEKNDAASVSKDNESLPFAPMQNNGSVPLGNQEKAHAVPADHARPAAYSKKRHAEEHMACHGSADFETENTRENPRSVHNGYASVKSPDDREKVVQMTLKDIEKAPKRSEESTMSELGSFSESELSSVIKSISLIMQSRRNGTERTKKLIEEISDWSDERLDELNHAVSGLLQYKTIMNILEDDNGGKYNA